MMRLLYAGRPDEFLNKAPKILPNPFLVKIDTFLFPFKKVAQQLVLLLKISKICPK
jgi:hypothetical protein